MCVDIFLLWLFFWWWLCYVKRVGDHQGVSWVPTSRKTKTLGSIHGLRVMKSVSPTTSRSVNNQKTRGVGGLGPGLGSPTRRPGQAWVLWCLGAVLLLCTGCPSRQRIVLPKSKRGQRLQALELRNARRRSHKKRKLRVRPATRSTHAYTHYIQGRLHAIAQRHRRAIHSFKLALVYDPHSPYLYYCIAQQHMQKGKKKNAMYWAKKALEKNARYAPAHYLLGRLYWRRKEPKLALASFRKALKASPRFMQAYIALDNALNASASPFSQRLKLLHRLVKNLPEQYQGYFRLGQLHEQYGKHEKAIAYYHKAINRNPSNTTALFLVARLYERRKRWNKAIANYRTLLDYLPRQWGVRVRLGAAFLHRGAPHDAKLAAYQFAFIQREATRYVPAARAYFVGRELLRRGHSKRAIRWLRKALKQRKAFAGARYFLGVALRRQGKKRNALRALRKISASRRRLYLEAQVQIVEMLLEDKKIKRARRVIANIRANPRVRPSVWLKLSHAFVEHVPAAELSSEIKLLKAYRQRWKKHEELHYHHAYLYFKQKKMATCRKLLRSLLKRNKNHARALNFLGYLYAEEKIRLKEAQQLVSRALRLEPANAYYLDSLGWIYFQQGNLKRAKSILEEVHKRLPQEATVLMHLAQLYQKQGNNQGALGLYQKVRRLKTSVSIQRRAEAQIQHILRKAPSAAGLQRPTTKPAQTLSRNPKRAPRS